MILDSLGLENPFNGLVDDLWEGGRLLTQEYCYFGPRLGGLPLL